MPGRLIGIDRSYAGGKVDALSRGERRQMSTQPPAAIPISIVSSGLRDIISERMMGRLLGVDSP
jgi:hypothetical protein